MGEQGNGIEASIALVRAALKEAWPAIKFRIKEYPILHPGIPDYIEINWASDPSGPTDAHVLLIAQRHYPYVLSDHSEGCRDVV